MISILLTFSLICIISLIVVIVVYNKIVGELYKTIQFGKYLNEHNDKFILELQSEIAVLKAKYIENVSISEEKEISKFVIEICQSVDKKLYFIIKYKKNGKVYMRTSEAYKNKPFLRKSAIEMSELLNCDLINREDK